MAKNEVPSIKLRRTSAGNLRNFFFFFTIIGIASIFFVRTFSSENLIFQMVIPGIVVILYSILIFQKMRCFTICFALGNMNSMFGGNMFADMDKMFGQQIGSIQNMLRDGNRNMITNGKNQNNQLANNKRGSGGNGNMMAAFSSGGMPE